MRTKVIELPNGFLDGTGTLITELEIRKLDGDDEEILLDKNEQQEGTALTRVLKNVIVRMGNATDSKMIGSLFDSNFLLADLSFLLVKLRMWGTDVIYKFTDKSPCCDKTWTHKIDLSTLTVTPQDSKYRGLKEYTDHVAVPDEEEHIFIHRPLLVRDQSMQRHVRETYPKEKATRELYIPIIRFDGAEPDIKVLKKLPMSVRNAMRALMDEKSGGIDIRLIMNCRRCGSEYNKPMPVDVTSFFFQVADSSVEPQTALPFRGYGPILNDSPKPLDGNPVRLEN